MTLVDAWALIGKTRGKGTDAAWGVVSAALKRSVGRHCSGGPTETVHGEILAGIFSVAQQGKLGVFDREARIWGYLRRCVKNKLARLPADDSLRRVELDTIGVDEEEDHVGPRAYEAPSEDPNVVDRMVHAHETGQRGRLGREYLSRAQALVQGLARRMIDGRLPRYRDDGERTWDVMQAYYLRGEPLDGLIEREEGTGPLAGAALTQARNRWYRRFSNFTEGLRGQLQAEWACRKLSAAEQRLASAYIDHFLTRLQLSAPDDSSV